MRQRSHLNRARVDVHAAPGKIDFVQSFLQRDETLLLDERCIDVVQRHDNARSLRQRDELHSRLEVRNAQTKKYSSNLKCSHKSFWQLGRMCNWTRCFSKCSRSPTINNIEFFDRDECLISVHSAGCDQIRGDYEDTA